MRKWFPIVFAILIVAVVGGIAWRVLRPYGDEPVYRGKRLSVWLADYQRSASGGWQGEEAVLNIGTNAIPTLLLMLQDKDSALTIKLNELAAKQSLVRIEYPSAWERNSHGEYGFRILGDRASNAVPELMRIFGQNISESSRRSTAEALGDIGPAAAESIPLLVKWRIAHPNKDWSPFDAVIHMLSKEETVASTLTELLRDPDPQLRSSAVYCLWRCGGRAKSTVAAWVELLRDPDEGVATFAALWLHRIDPETAAKEDLQPAVRTLMTRLDHPDARKREGVAYSLGTLGAVAKPAVPPLLKLLTDPDLKARTNAAEALKQIDSVIAAKVMAESHIVE